MGHSRISRRLPPEQSRHFSRIALMGVSLVGLSTSETRGLGATFVRSALSWAPVPGSAAAPAKVELGATLKAEVSCVASISSSPFVVSRSVGRGRKPHT
jgi:hypothetical protein